MKLERLAVVEVDVPRQLILAVVDGLHEWPEVLDAPEPFILLTAVDASKVDDETLRGFASRVLPQGCIFVLSWGRDCKRIHDAFDDERLLWALHGDPYADVTTVWFDDEPLRDALWDAVFNAWQEDHDAASVITLASPEHAAEIRAALSKPELLNHDEQ